LGDVPNELIADSDSSPICKSIDEYANYEIMHRDGFGKTDGLPYHAFDPGAPRGVFAFDLLRMLFPNCRLVRIHVTAIGPPPVCVQGRDATWREECFPLYEGRILACAKDIGSDRSRGVINRLPQPPLLVFAAYKAPQLIHLGCLSLVDGDLHLLSLKTLEKAFIYLL